MSKCIIETDPEFCNWRPICLGTEESGIWRPAGIDGAGVI